MIAHGGLIAKHMLHEVGHEKTFGKPEPYQHVEHWTEQSRERCEQVGNGSGPEPERQQDRHLVPSYLTRPLSHDHGRSHLFLSDGKTGRICRSAPCGLLVQCNFHTVNQIGEGPASRPHLSAFGRAAKLVTVLKKHFLGSTPA